jgi:hypothetical protein
MAIKVEHIMSYEVPADGVSRWSTACANADCKFALPPLKEISVEYFETGNVICSKCGEGTDIWKSMQESARVVSYGTTDLVGFGALSSLFKFPLTKGQIQEIQFSELGIPENAVIFSILYSSNGGPTFNCWPVEISRCFWLPRFYDNKVQIYGLPAAEDGEDIEVWGSVTWVHNDDDSEPWRLLAEAYEAVIARKPSRVLIPAHSAFEISLSRLIRQILERYASKGKVKEFMVKNLTADAASNVMLPLLCAHVGVNTLPKEIAGKLSRLRSLRNDIAHEGLTDDQLELGEIKELLCASVFGFEFIRFVKSKLIEPLG